MGDKKLYSTKEIAKIYNVTSHTITKIWIPEGLKYKKGPRRSFRFKLEWVDEYIDETVIEKYNIQDKEYKISKSKNKVKKQQYVV